MMKNEKQIEAALLARGFSEKVIVNDGKLIRAVASIATAIVEQQSKEFTEDQLFRAFMTGRITSGLSVTESTNLFNKLLIVEINYGT